MRRHRHRWGGRICLDASTTLDACECGAERETRTTPDGLVRTVRESTRSRSIPPSDGFERGWYMLVYGSDGGSAKVRRIDDP